MKKILLNGAALIALVTSASAADLGARAPGGYAKAPSMVSPLTNWSGFYIGAMGGYGWSNDSGNDKFKGGFGGGTLGYNWQTGPVVFGVEADAAASGIKASASDPTLTVTDKIRSFGSATGRVGFAMDSVLFYAKGGYAWANNRVTIANGTTFTGSKMHNGWTMGGGVEYMLASNWSAKAEYMYADFASVNYFSNVVAGGFDSGKQKLHTVKAGVNYHF